MSTATLPAERVTVPLFGVERELTRQMNALQGCGDSPMQRVRMSNLVIFCNGAEGAEAASVQVPRIVAVHPARVLLLICESKAADNEITATVQVQGHQWGSHQQACSEQVVLRAGGGLNARLPFAVRNLLIGDLPTNLWWAANQPPPLAGPFLYDLADRAQQIIYDSLGWVDPAKGVAATANWLEQVEGVVGGGRWRVASDLNWRRLKFWRRLLSQALDPASSPGTAESVTELLIEHGPHAVVQGWELAAWLSQRLRWKLRTAKVQPGVEISWRFEGGNREPRVRIKRLAEGPPEIRRIRISCTLQGQPVVLNLESENATRLILTVEGQAGAPRTLNIPPQTDAELVGRQLSDREPDPVFRESMRVARMLAQSVLG